MDDLTKCLYDFVSDQCAERVFKDPKYREAAQNVELQSEKVQQGMSEGQKRELNLLLDHVYALFCVESEHMFQAAMGLARELGRAAGTP